MAGRSATDRDTPDFVATRAFRLGNHGETTQFGPLPLIRPRGGDMRRAQDRQYCALLRLQTVLFLRHYVRKVGHNMPEGVNSGRCGAKAKGLRVR